MWSRERLEQDLAGFADQAWLDNLLAECTRKIQVSPHGDLPRWQAALSALPKVRPTALQVVDGAVAATSDLGAAGSALAREQLLQLVPWRKGPFRIGTLVIDTEWRSDLKWSRIEDAVAPLTGRRILDVGCGNGYYAWRMRHSGARLVVGIDPTLLFVAQYAAIAHFLQPQPVHVLPLRLQQLPAGGPRFDTVFSMGVLYHQRTPHDHLKELQAMLRPGGELILETLIIPGENAEYIVPESRYARMRNVWHLPTRTCLLEWLAAAGFAGLQVVDESRTTTAEQRPTEWMPFQSLAHALDPQQPSLTVEGLPAPLRIVVVARRPPS